MSQKCEYVINHFYGGNIKMKKVLAILLALVMVFSFAACGDNNSGKEQEQQQEQQSTVEVVKGVTIPEFTLKVCGVKITNEDMAAYDLYSYTANTVNSSGTSKSNVFIGFKMSDVLDAWGITGTFGKATCKATDDYTVEYEGNLLADNCFVAISKDGTQFKNGPWFAPGESGTTGDYLQDLAKIEIEGATAPADRVAQGEEKKSENEGPTELAAPDVSDKTGKITFTDFCFQVNGKDVKNADLEGLSIYKAKVTVQNSKGAISEVTYSGYVLKDVLEKLGINASKVTVVANDGYTSELSAEDIASDITLIAIEKDKAVSENGTVWVAPCNQSMSNAYARDVVNINAD